MFVKPFFFFQFFVIFYFFNISINFLISLLFEGAILSEFQLLLAWFLFIFFVKFVYYDEYDYNVEQLGENNNDGLDYDLFFRFINLCLDQLWFFNSLLVTEFKRWKLFTFKFKYFYFNKTNSMFFDFKTKKLFLIWRPIFKKWSYLGYYRANRSKWIK